MTGLWGTRGGSGASADGAAAVLGPRPQPGPSRAPAGIGLCRARAGPRARELGRGRHPVRAHRAGASTSTAFPRSPPALSPQEQSSPPPCPGAALRSGVWRPGVPTPPIMRPRPSVASWPALPPVRETRSGLEGLFSYAGLVLCEPLLRVGETQRCRRGLPAPLPSRRNNGGQGRRGRGPRPRAGSRCARGLRPGPAAAPPRRAPNLLAAPGPPGARAHLVLGRHRVSPRFQNPPGKAPRAKALAREIAFWRLRGWAGAPQAAGSGRGMSR